jgi:hypothetical protein
VFLSYATADHRVAQELATALRDGGFDVPMDLDARTETRDLDLRGDSERSIMRWLDEADAFVVLVSTAAYATPSIRSEWIRIVKRIWGDATMIALPVLLDDSDPPGFLSNHTAVHWDVDYLRDPRERGVHQTAEGRIRRDHRLAEIEREATALVEAAMRE